MSVSAIQSASLGRALDPHDPVLVRQTAAQMVSELFFKPLLAQMRSFPFGNEIGGGGRGEAVFGERLDEYLADAAANADGGGLVDQIVKYLAPESAAATPTGTAPPATCWSTVTQLQQTVEGLQR